MRSAPSDLDPRHLPLYGVREAARYIGVPEGTMRAWTRTGVDGPPLIAFDPGTRRLTFANLVEAYVVKQMRKFGDVSMPALRRAAASAPALGLPRMLLSQNLRWGGEVFWEDLERDALVNLTRAGQVAMRDLIGGALTRIEWDDATHLPTALTPAIRGLDMSRAIVRLDPAIRFGQPTVAGVPTRVLVRRVNAGDSPALVADDYGLSEEDVTAALVYEEVGAA